MFEIESGIAVEAFGLGRVCVCITCRFIFHHRSPNVIIEPKSVIRPPILKALVAMAELSTQLTCWLLEWLEAHSISGEQWTQGTSLQVEDLSDPDQTISWEHFALLCDRLGEFCGDDCDGIAALPPAVEIGREIAEELFAAFSERFSSGATPLEILF